MANKVTVEFLKRCEDRDKTGAKVVIKAGTRLEMTPAEAKKAGDKVRVLPAEQPEDTEDEASGG